MSDMSILKKIELFGIGTIAITQEKLEKFTQEMIKKGEMNREEGKTFVIKILLEKDKQLKDIEDRINQKIKDLIESSGIATKEDVEALKKKLETLEETFEKLRLENC